MPSRQIYSKARGNSVQLLGCISSLLALELLNPSKTLYLFSPWLSKVMLLNNQFGQYRSILSDPHKSQLNLADVLIMLAKRGTLVHIACRRPNNDQTTTFISLLSGIKGITVRYAAPLHAKGLVTDHFFLSGSMNFTYAGIYLNDEFVELKADADAVGQALLEARLYWEGLK